MDPQLSTVRRSMSDSVSRRGAGTRSAAGFTLVEMLIVVAIIAMLSALTLPALQGLVGASGLRGGVNSVLAAMEQARNAAIEAGGDVYVGFPVAGATGDEADYSSLIVFRGPGPSVDPGEKAYKPLSRWVRLPQGIVIDPAGANLVPPPELDPASLPKLGNKHIEVQAIRIDRFGRIANAPAGNDPLQLKIGEGTASSEGVTWLGPFGKNYEILTAQRLTGRWLVSRP